MSNPRRGVRVPGLVKFDHIWALGASLGFGDHLMPWGQAPGKGYAKRFYVDPTNGNDNWSGLSWSDPFATFEKAIDSARFPHGTTSLTYTDKSLRAFVFLAPGHYNEDTDHANQYLWSGYNISVIGCSARPGKDYGVSFNYDASASSTACFLLSGSGNEIYNIHITNDAAIPALYIAGGDNNLVHSVVIECDGTTATYGIQADSMKGSKIEDVTIRTPITAGIIVNGGSNHYFIDGEIVNCKIYCATNGAKGIYVTTNNVVYNAWIRDNLIQMAGGSSDIGVDCRGNAMVVNNFISVPSSGDPIYHTGGEQYQIGNHTVAGTTNVDPDPAAG